MPLSKTLKKSILSMRVNAFVVVHARQCLCCSEYCHVVVQELVVCVCMGLRAYIVPIFM
jgi:hypothetical protein